MGLGGEQQFGNAVPAQLTLAKCSVLLLCAVGPLAVSAQASGISDTSDSFHATHEGSSSHAACAGSVTGQSEVRLSNAPTLTGWGLGGGELLGCKSMVGEGSEASSFFQLKILIPGIKMFKILGFLGFWYWAAGSSMMELLFFCFFFPLED